MIEQEDGSASLSEYIFHCGDGRPIGEFGKSWRSAVRNFDRSGVSQPVGMLISGHKTASVYRRYRITPDQDIQEPWSARKPQTRKTKNIRLSLFRKPGKNPLECLLAQVPHNLHRNRAAPCFDGKLRY